MRASPPVLPFLRSGRSRAEGATNPISAWASPAATRAPPARSRPVGLKWRGDLRIGLRVPELQPAQYEAVPVRRRADDAAAGARGGDQPVRLDDLDRRGRGGRVLGMQRPGGA